MLDGATTQEKYGLVAAFALVVLASFAAGTMFSHVNSATGAVTSGNQVSSGAVKQKIQSLMDKQLQQQRQQFSMIASQNPNMTASDLSVNAQVTDVSPSKFGSLQKVTVKITGTVPAQTGGTRSLNREQTFYVSPDGTYLFQQPVNLDQTQQPAPQPQPSGQ